MFCLPLMRRRPAGALPRRRDCDPIHGCSLHLQVIFLAMASPDKFDNSRFTRVSCHDLLLGMFIAELDRPWKETPFPIDGFHLRRIEDLETLKLFCHDVVIDLTRGVAPKRQRAAALTILSSARKRSPPVAEMVVNHLEYQASRSVKQEVDTAERLYSELGTLYNSVIENARQGRPLRLETLHQAIAGIRECVVRCPDAFIWFLNTNGQENCLLPHSLRATIWALLLGRHVGLPTADMDVLGKGTLLADLGMVKFPRELLHKTGCFRRREYLAYQKHVRISEDLLRIDGNVDNSIMSIVRAHHERHDGHGFPRGQRGDQIPMLARFANLAYCYDRLLRPGPNGVRVAPANALSRLFKQRKLKFVEQLVFEFIQVQGMYPAGSLVELNSREIAVVIQQNPADKLQPVFALLTDEAKNLLKKPRVVQPAEARSPGSEFAVLKPLELGSYGIHPQAMREAIFGRRIAIGKLGIRF